MKNTLSRIEKEFDERFDHIADNPYQIGCNIFNTDGSFMGGCSCQLKSIKSFYRHQILALIEELEAGLPKNRKPKYNKAGTCRYCGYTKSGCECGGYNSALSEVKTILDNYKKEIQK